MILSGYYLIRPEFQNLIPMQREYLYGDDYGGDDGHDATNLCPAKMM